MGQIKTNSGKYSVFSIIMISFAKKCQDIKRHNMLFEEKIKELRTQQQLPQRKLAAALDIDTATYCKIEKGERKAKREQVVMLSEMLNVKDDSLLTLWLADRVTSVVSNDHSIAQDALSIVASSMNSK